MHHAHRASTAIRFFALALSLAAAGFLHARSLNQIATEVLSSTESGATLRLTLPEWRPEESDQDSGAAPDWPSYSLLRALPLSSQGYDIQVGDIIYRDPTFDEMILASELEAPNQSITALPMARMRGIPLATVRVNLLDHAQDNTLRAIRSCEITLSARLGAPQNNTRLLSSSFCNLLRPLVANLDEVAPAPVDSPEPYLIITRPFYQNASLDQFVAWKQRKGHSVTVASTTETGTTNQQIKSFIQNAYDMWDEPPVYVLLIGDEDGVNSMPGWTLDAYHLATLISDHPYTTLDGEDYLPDVFVGRFSVDTAGELATLVAKSVEYEHVPFEPLGEWRTRMLICGVKSSPQQFQTYNSAWPTLRWIAGEFLQRGYADIDSVPYVGGNASQINQSINNGVSFVAYRGFGSPEDWAYPPYSIDNIEQVSNGRKLPVITSIVCGGGAFDSETDPCFGEAWLRLGTGSNQKGAVGFIGPSELDTKTRMNNTIIASMYQGVLHEEVSTLGGLLVRGKLGLYANFPNNIDEFDADANLSVPFYFNCYNLLGDPGLCFYVGPANSLTTTAEDTLRAGIPTTRFRVTSDGAAVPNAWATAIRGGQVLGRAVGDSDGWVILPLPQDTGLVEITVARPRYAVWED
ncbi:hypothetical protein IT157_10460, partial [bacterium]|nr:hypothetical protein [bacterium]